MKLKPLGLILKNKTYSLLFITLISMPGVSYSEAKVIPVVSGYLSLGQWYVDGDRSSLGGNAQMTFIPAIRFSDKFSLLPTLRTNYRGTRHAQELAGGNTLFQDTWENEVEVKGVWKIGQSWKGRLRGDYQSKWFRETSNEVWSKGLYDYQIATAGGELERFFGTKSSLAMGYDYSDLKFPNYQSLESDQSQTLAREFSGSDVLDAKIHLLSMRADIPLPFRIKSNFQSYYSPREFPDQTIVELSGSLINESRKDEYFGINGNLQRIFPINPKTFLLGSFYYGFTTLDSNQNHYNARLTTFVPDFYDYDQQRLGGQISFAFWEKKYGHTVIDVSSFYIYRKYRERITQQPNGAYNQDEKLHTTEENLNIGFSYPMSKNFKIRMTSFFSRNKSNNDYEDLYKYDFNSANYQFGFTYDY